MENSFEEKKTSSPEGPKPKSENPSSEKPTKPPRKLVGSKDEVILEEDDSSLVELG